jgi:hypothetical protein
MCFLIPLLVSAADFSKLLPQRIGRIIWHQTTLSFPLGEHRNYKTYNDFIFSDTMKRFFTDVQNSFQEGSTILAWVSAPFHFNYARNTIFSVGDASGLNAPWLNLPVGADHRTMRDFLLRKQIKYIIWEYKGYSMRTRREYRKLAASPYVGRKMVGENGLFMYETFEKLVKGSRVIFGNERIIVCELEKR